MINKIKITPKQKERFYNDQNENGISEISDENMQVQLKRYSKNYDLATKKIRQILKKNKQIVSRFEGHQDIAKDLKHWAQYSDIEEWLDDVCIINRDYCIVVLSNETSINLHEFGDNCEFEYSLDPTLRRDLEKAGFCYEYSCGGFEVFNENEK